MPVYGVVYSERDHIGTHSNAKRDFLKFYRPESQQNEFMQKVIVEGCFICRLPSFYLRCVCHTSRRRSRTLWIVLEMYCVIYEISKWFTIVFFEVRNLKMVATFNAGDFKFFYIKSNVICLLIFNFMCFYVYT